MKKRHKTAVALTTIGGSCFVAHVLWGQIGVAVLVGLPLLLIPFAYLYRHL